MIRATEAARVRLPTAAGEFEARAFEVGGGLVYLTLIRGDVQDGSSVLTRIHSECLTGDAMGSLRCDCGVQLQHCLELLAQEGRGVLVYATGQEGRGIGLINKLNAYREQELGADTLDANLRLGLPADGRRYTEAAAVLTALGMRSVRLLSNNPHKAEGLRAEGIKVERLVPLATVSNAHNLRYLQTKRDRMGHINPAGVPLPAVDEQPVDAGVLLGAVRPRTDRPYVLVRYAQTLDGWIVATGDGSRQSNGAAGRRLVHTLRTACDAVLVGSGTVLADDPRLTVRLVAGPSPLRVVLDSRLRIPLTANVLNGDAPTLVLTADRADTREKRQALAARNVSVRTVEAAPDGLDLQAVLAVLRAAGVGSVMVEGGARVITSMLAAGVADRLVAAITPRILGAGAPATGPPATGPPATGPPATGTPAIGDPPVGRVTDVVELTNRAVHPVGDEVLLSFDVAQTS